MRTKTILITLFVISLTMLGAILWRNAAMTAAAANDAKPKAMILVAAQPLATGTLLRAEDVKWQAWNGAVEPGAIVRPSEEDRRAKPNADAQILANVYGAVVRQRVEIGQPIISSIIVKPGERGFLAAVLSPGYRAIDIGVTAVSSAAGLIFPGDHVDVILTQSFNQNEEPLSRRAVGETIVSNLRVLAIDQRPQQATTDSNNSSVSDGSPQATHSVTLEVLPKQAEIINVAAVLGKLSLTLRNVPTTAEPVTADSQVEEPSQSTWAADVSPALRSSRNTAVTAASSEIRIMRGSKTEDVKD